MSGDSFSDVIVVGLGAMGSAAAHHLAARGCRVRGFDRLHPPHTMGSSHGLSRIFRQAYFEDARYVPLLMHAFKLWQRLERESGERLLELTGAMLIGPRGGDLVARSAESAREFGLAHEMLDAAALRERYPLLAVEHDTVALLERDAGYLRPERCVEQHLRLAEQGGAAMHYDEPVLAWDAPAGGGVSVRTAKGTYSAERLVLTVGPWAPRVLAEMGLPLRVTRQVLCWFEPRGEMADFRGDRLPVYLIEPPAGQPLLYGFPATGPDAEGVKVALHGVEELCTPETVERAIRPGDEAVVRERLRTTIPTLAGRMLRGETCLYTMTPDEHFVIDAHPRHPAVILAAGFSGHGFKFASVVGEILADLASTGRSRHDLSMFRVDRFAGGTAANRP